MAFTMHPLTALNGVPTYTADDYRHVVNPFMFPSDRTPFGCVSCVRAGSPWPVASVKNLTVTVFPHCGVVNPWSGVGAYTYALKKSEYVNVPDSTGNYKVAVVVNDPSQSHGSTPRGLVKVYPAGTADADIPGVVLAVVNAGVVNCVAPRLHADGVIEVNDGAWLERIPALEGAEAVTSVDGRRYRRHGSVWVPLTDITLNPGQWAKDWNVDYRCSMVGNIVNICLKVSRKTEWVATAWSRSQLFTFPDYLTPKLSDINVPAAGVEYSGFQVDPSGLYVRPFRNITYAVGLWNTAAFSYSV